VKKGVIFPPKRERIPLIPMGSLPFKIKEKQERRGEIKKRRLVGINWTETIN
jgi:hypothetical protein